MNVNGFPLFITMVKLINGNSKANLGVIMKHLAFAICGIFILLHLSCESEQSKHEKISEQLLEQANEGELWLLYDDLLGYFEKDENYAFVKEENGFRLKNEPIKHVMLSLYDFHKKNHLPILQDQEHPENAENWFYFYNLLLQNEDTLSEEQIEHYDSLTTECDYCRLAFKNNLDIAWPEITYDLINNFPKLKEEALYNINRLNAAKEKADAEEAERRRIEASRLTGVQDYKFGMSKAEVKKKWSKAHEKEWVPELKIVDIGILGSEPYIAEVLVGNSISYGQISFDAVSFLFINDKLYKVYLIYDGNTYNNSNTFAAIKSLVNSIVSKYEFNGRPVDGSTNIGPLNMYGKTYKKFDKTEVFYGSSEQGFGACSALITFEDIKIRENNYNQALQKYKDSMTNRNDF